MRRRRKTLEVSTFPFLAVLLCTMGALILLLLVLDRRAKAVALARARKAAEQQEAKADIDAAERERAEWERRRRALHAALAAQEEELRRQLAEVQGRIRAAAADTEAGKEKLRGRLERLNAVRAEVVKAEQELAGVTEQASQLDRESESSRAELARMTADLRLLERTVAELKAARERLKQTYSLVPYRGKRGENRRPIYLECAATGMVFHPDKKVLIGTLTTAEQLRAEVERRVQKLQAARPPGAPPERPYLLLLVRPDGIVNFYRVQRGLRGVDIDFGYEFIDADWVLDFPTDDNTPASQPWMTAVRPLPYPPEPCPIATTRPAGRPQGMAFGSEEAGPGAGQTVLAQRSAPGGGGLPLGAGPGGSRYGPGSGPFSGGGSPIPGQGSGPVSGSGGPYPGGSSPFGGNGSALPAGSGQGSAAAAGLGQGVPAAGAGPGGGLSVTRGGKPPGPQGGSPPPGPLDRDPSSAPRPSGGGSILGGGGGAPSGGQGGPPPDGTGDGPRGPRLPPDPLPVPQPAPPRRPIARPVYGSRDFLIWAECTADALIIHPYGWRYKTAELEPGQAGARDLQRAIRQMIDRR
ncbi:MAG TPA: hypothetical protein VFA26_19390, partial [Gemmataceae bacterium]|nr:hypothetical protein [Gemmataceae bacterium]